jgi:transposase-like protein
MQSRLPRTYYLTPQERQKILNSQLLTGGNPICPICIPYHIPCPLCSSADTPVIPYLQEVGQQQYYCKTCNTNLIAGNSGKAS